MKTMLIAVILFASVSATPIDDRKEECHLTAHWAELAAHARQRGHDQDRVEHETRRLLYSTTRDAAKAGITAAFEHPPDTLPAEVANNVFTHCVYGDMMRL